jgi:hypothetical protein
MVQAETGSASFVVGALACPVLCLTSAAWRAQCSPYQEMTMRHKLRSVTRLGPQPDSAELFPMASRMSCFAAGNLCWRLGHARPPAQHLRGYLVEQR